ncbi:MAG: methylenetetrahydrofolate--tRNA-(uracil(54)-C(5))-methyltransferase (FADH(2)-oxidizing) TrmFO [Selenomonadaceae bacterium]|nr:methylenetetrahydrofolate--tRNA-(uracil(54)-C(5))-methyltransferase (FADH(2)-oxidizing) TrmFO [Selenomonadaceae bacterium]
MNKKVHIIGAGLAGSEAAFQVANRGVEVILHEMRPLKQTPAHKTENFAELVCSNSLRAAGLSNAVGVLKEEMRRLNSVIISAADENKIPAGGALAVDREKFSLTVTQKVKALPNVTFVQEEVTNLESILNSDDILIIASGPLTEGLLAEEIKRLTGGDEFYFYDAAAPIVTLDSVNFDKAYKASRYGKGAEFGDGSENAYINCPMTREEYLTFRAELINAEKTKPHEFEKEIFFEGCLPVEVLASRGEDTLRFGPMKPVGLEEPRTGKLPYAVVQLRQDNGAATLYNLVGFQTHLTWGEQRRVFRMIPGLESAQIVRYGVMHRNTYINSPKVLLPTFQLKSARKIFFAGQITGVEGYVESAAAGLMAGINAARLAKDLDAIIFPPETCHGALANYITTETKNFQPMNVTFGLLPPFEERVRKSNRKEKLAERALSVLDDFILKLDDFILRSDLK